ncbi:MAG: hypothetical protein NVSMB19_21700 [Vulcanimicrobiaceae bacterium]
MKKKLLMLVSPRGDAMVRDVLDLATQLRADHDILVLASPDHKRRFSDAGVRCDAWRPGGFIGMGIAVVRLRRVVTAFAPDLVHAHGFPAVAVALGTFPAALASRTVVTFHEPQRDKELPQKLVDRKLPGYVRRAAHRCATYPSLARALEKRLELDDGAIEVVPHAVAVPLDGGAPLVRPRARSGPIVGWRGYFTADRSWETAIDAFAELRKRFPDARMEVAGAGRARNFVVAHARHLNLADVVHFRGDVSAAAHFAAIDVLAVPISNDAQPQAPLEALVAGIPIVAANVGALKDAILPLPTGWLVPDDTAGFVAGLSDAWTTIDAAWAGAAQQREEARARYGREVVGARYREIFADVMARA